MNTPTLAVIIALIMGGVITACAPDTRITTGRGDYMTFCADCHGVSGKGNGPAAANLLSSPADLTRIAARNGDSFPRNQIMGRIYGYTMGKSEDPMPAFGDLLEGKTILYDAGDGVQTPTPWRLVALTEYLEGLQK